MFKETTTTKICCLQVPTWRPVSVTWLEGMMVSTIAICGVKSTPWTFSSAVLKGKVLWIQRWVSNVITFTFLLFGITGLNFCLNNHTCFNTGWKGVQESDSGSWWLCRWAGHAGNLPRTCTLSGCLLSVQGTDSVWGTTNLVIGCSPSEVLWGKLCIKYFWLWLNIDHISREINLL